MKNILQQVKYVVEREHMLAPSDCVVVGISGGADSVALLSVLSSLGWRCIAAHCNFHLRGDESDRDMQFVSDLCSKLNIPLEITHFDTVSYCREQKVSTEMACRELRYNWFEDLREKHNAQAIAVGHHKEDRIETFFINLLRGAGITGLTSMRPKSGNVIRPIIECSRIEIEQYLEEIGLTWITDSTNACDDFVRNRLRNNIIPLLDEMFVGASDSVLRSISNLVESKQFYDRAITNTILQYIDPSTESIDLRVMEKENADAPLLLFETLRNEGFSRQQTDDMLSAAKSYGGIFISGTIRRDVDHGCLRPAYQVNSIDNTPINVDISRSITVPIHIDVSFHDIVDFKPSRDPKVIYLDESAASDNNQWQLRNWLRGDRMIPFGKHKSKLLSDIFADSHLTAKEKNDIWLLTCNDQIIWAVGLRASSHFAITDKTTRYIKLEIK